MRYHIQGFTGPDRTYGQSSLIRFTRTTSDVRSSIARAHRILAQCPGVYMVDIRAANAIIQTVTRQTHTDREES